MSKNGNLNAENDGKGIFHSLLRSWKKDKVGVVMKPITLEVIHNQKGY